MCVWDSQSGLPHRGCSRCAVLAPRCCSRHYTRSRHCTSNIGHSSKHLNMLLFLARLWMNSARRLKTARDLRAVSTSCRPSERASQSFVNKNDGVLLKFCVLFSQYGIPLSTGTPPTSVL